MRLTSWRSTKPSNLAMRGVARGDWNRRWATVSELRTRVPLWALLRKGFDILLGGARAFRQPHLLHEVVVKHMLMTGVGRLEVESREGD
jgi:hypothetical protein